MNSTEVYTELLFQGSFKNSAMSSRSDPISAVNSLAICPLITLEKYFVSAFDTF